MAEQEPGLRNAEDVVSFLKDQHEELKAKMPGVLQSTGLDRRDHFLLIRQMIAVHEALEQEAVHPRARADTSDNVVDARLREEGKAEDAIAELETLDLESEEFEERYSKLQVDVIAHAEHEEREEFSALAGELSDEERARINVGASLAGYGAAGTFLGNTFAEMFRDAKQRIIGATGPEPTESEM